MNYFALAVAVYVALVALNSIVSIIRVSVGLAQWNSEWSFAFHALLFSAGVSVAVWLFSVAAG